MLFNARLVVSIFFPYIYFSVLFFPGIFLLRQSSKSARNLKISSCFHLHFGPFTQSHHQAKGADNDHWGKLSVVRHRDTLTRALGGSVGGIRHHPV